MIKRGTWIPLIPDHWRTLVVSFVPITPIIIGLDYIMGENGQSLSNVEKSAPIWIWGSLLVLGGLITITGFIGRWRWISIVGLWYSGAVMVTLSVGIASVTLDEVGGFRWPWLYFAVGLASWLSAIGYFAQEEE